MAAIENAQKAGRSQQRPRYYAEKVPRWCYELLHKWLPIRGIYLLRDPRDVLLSALAFDEKRGLRGWSPNPGQPLDEFVRQSMPIVRDRLQQAIAFLRPQSPETQILVRYEDMALDLKGTAKRLGNWLSVPLDAEATLAVSRKFLNRHSTSADPQASVKRWKRELPQGINAIYVEHLSMELLQLGYDLE